MNVRFELPDELVDVIADAVVERLAWHMPRPEPWRLLPLEEAAARLTRSPRWLRTKAKTGAIPYVHLGAGGYAFDPDDLREWARSGRVGASDRVAGVVAGGRNGA